MKKVLLFILSTLMITAVAAAETGSDFPKSSKQQKSESYGSIFGNNGFQLFGKGKKGDSSPENSSSKTNPFLWHAALDVIQFMPLASTDFSGGVINTDWYDDQDFKDVKYKVNIVIKSSQLDVNSISVKVFKKKLIEGQWKDIKTSNSLAVELEDKILSKARELKNIQTEIQ